MTGLGELPPVTLEGDYNNLQVVVHLPHSQYTSLPDEIVNCLGGIRISTVLFNKGEELPTEFTVH